MQCVKRYTIHGVNSFQKLLNDNIHSRHDMVLLGMWCWLGPGHSLTELYTCTAHTREAYQVDVFHGCGRPSQSG